MVWRCAAESALSIGRYSHAVSNDSLGRSCICCGMHLSKFENGRRGWWFALNWLLGWGTLSLPRPRPASRKLMMTRRKKGSALSRRRDCALAMGRDEGKIKSVEGGMCESRAS